MSVSFTSAGVSLPPGKENQFLQYLDGRWQAATPFSRDIDTVSTDHELDATTNILFVDATDHDIHVLLPPVADVEDRSYKKEERREC
ncbi:MAG: hypothetical protein QME81_06960 [bacterium]|nr:hypothetical protein [bacterium]